MIFWFTNWEDDSADPWIMLSSLSIETWDIFNLRNYISALLSNNLVISAHYRCLSFRKGIRAGKVVGSFRGGTLLESLLVITFRIVSVLELELMLSSLLLSEEEEDNVMRCLNTNNFYFSFLLFFLWMIKRHMTLQLYDMMLYA